MSQSFRTTPVSNVDCSAASAWFTPVLTGEAGTLSITINRDSGTVNGTFTVQSTNFDGTNPRTAPAYNSSAWVNYPGSTNPAVAATITSAIQWDITDAAAKWWQVIFTDGSSSTPRVSYVTSFHTTAL